MTGADRWFISDKAIVRDDQDKFGHVDVASQLAHIVETFEGDRASAAIGLIGGFGTGKSSISNLLAARMANHSRLHVVALSGERHTGVARQRALVYSFGEALYLSKATSKKKVEDLLRYVEIGEDTEQTAPGLLPFATFLSDNRSKLWRGARWLVVIAAVSYLLGVAGSAIVNAFRSQSLQVWTWPTTGLYSVIAVVVSVLGAGGSLVMPWLRAAFSPGRLTRHRPRAEAADELERVFIRLSELTSKQLVIVVDDLDRLPPEQVLEALATIKSFQSVPGDRRAIFIIACDDEIVRRAIQEARPGLSPVDGSDRKAAEEYLNKFFLVRQPLPPPLPEDMTAYAHSLLNNPENHHAGPAALGDNVASVLDVLIHDGVTEPRHVVRLLNAFFADYRLAHVREGADQRLGKGAVTDAPLTLARLTVLRVDFPWAYSAIRGEHELLRALDKDLLGETIDASDRELIQRAGLPLSTAPRDRQRNEEGGPGQSDDQEADGPDDVTQVGTEFEPTTEVARRNFELTTFLRRTARYVKGDVPLAPLFYFSQTDAGRVLGSRRAEELRIALESNDTDAVRARFTDDPAIATATARLVIEVLNRTRPGLPRLNAIATASAAVDAAPADRQEEVAAKIAELINQEPATTPSPGSLVRVIQRAPTVHRGGLIARLVTFGNDEDEAPRAFAIAELALADHDPRLAQALADFFTRLPNSGGFTAVAPWLGRAEAADSATRDRLFGPDFYAAAASSVIGTNPGNLEEADVDRLVDLLGASIVSRRTNLGLLTAVHQALAAEGSIPRWVAMRMLEVIAVDAGNVSVFITSVATVCTSEEVPVDAGTLSTAMRILARFSEEQPSATAEVSADLQAAGVSAVVAALESDDTSAAAAGLATAALLAPAWPTTIIAAIPSVVSRLDGHRRLDDETGVRAQDALLAFFPHVPNESHSDLSQPLLQPVADATDANDAALRLALGAEQRLCDSDDGRAQVAAHTTSWRTVYTGAITSSTQWAPQTEALAIAASHSALPDQQQLVSTLSAVLSQAAPAVDAAGLALAAIPWSADARTTATQALDAAWDQLTEATQNQVAISVIEWPAEGPPLDQSLTDRLAHLVLVAAKPELEDQLNKLWRWLSFSGRGQVYGSSNAPESFVRRRIAEADGDEMFEAIRSCARADSLDRLVGAIDDQSREIAGETSERFIRDSLLDEATPWNDKAVQQVCALVGVDSAAGLAEFALAELGEGETRAAHGASLFGWLRDSSVADLSDLSTRLAVSTVELLPEASADLAGRLGYANRGLSSTSVSSTIKEMRKSKDDRHDRRAAAEAYESAQHK